MIDLFEEIVSDICTFLTPELSLYVSLSPSPALFSLAERIVGEREKKGGADNDMEGGGCGVETERDGQVVLKAVNHGVEEQQQHEDWK